MRICFVSGQTLSNVLENYADAKADLFLFGFNGGKEISYEAELQGKSNYFEKVAVLSKQTKSVVVSGCVTDARGLKRNSALIAENGRLKGVSDMLHVIDETLCSGAALRVYETKIGKMGVAVADDLRFPDVVKSLVDCGSDFIVCPYKKMEKDLQAVLVRANAYFYGTPIFFCASGYAMIANPQGEVFFSSTEKVCFSEFENKTEYHLVQIRRKGYYSKS